MPGVDMTSNVKSWLPIFLHFLRPIIGIYRKSRSQYETTVDPANIRGLAPTLFGPSRVPASLEVRGFLQPHNADENCTKPGLPLCRWRVNMVVCALQSDERPECYGVTGTGCAMAHIKALSSRAMATTTRLACLPRALNCR